MGSDLLTRNPWPLVADLIEQRGWIQGVEEDAAGHVCLHGAIRLCDLQPGDWPIVSEVAARRGRDTGWNDAEGRTADEVTGWLRQDASDIGDDELEAIYGPQWRFVVELVRKAASLTDAERSAYRDAWRADYDADRTGWYAAWRAVVVYVGPGGAAYRALGAFVGDDCYAVVGAALARRHEVAASDYDRLTGPWRRLVGPIHPDDETLS